MQKIFVTLLLFFLQINASFKGKIKVWRNQSTAEKELEIGKDKILRYRDVLISNGIVIEDALEIILRSNSVRKWDDIAHRCNPEISIKVYNKAVSNGQL